MKVGDLVIVNEWDRPCARLIAAVVEINEDAGSITCRYIAKELEKRSDYIGPLSAAQEIWKFGVAIDIGGDEAWCDAIAETKATYPNGAPRRWQDEFSEGVRLGNFGKAAVMNYLESAEKEGSTDGAANPG